MMMNMRLIRMKVSLRVSIKNDESLIHIWNHREGVKSTETNNNNSSNIAIMMQMINMQEVNMAVHPFEDKINKCSVHILIMDNRHKLQCLNMKERTFIMHRIGNHEVHRAMHNLFKMYN